MHWKKYIVIFPITAILSIISYFIVPESFRPTAPFLIVLIAWVIYYAWIFVENKKKNSAV